MPKSLDPERARIQADLSGLIDGEVHCDAAFLQMYACDASIYEVLPLGVVRPAGVQDVVACVKYAQENQIPLIPRGAGSNVAGGSIGAGLILDLSYSMRRVEAVGREDVTVQPGVVLGDLNHQLKSHGRVVGPDPATRMVTTIGGAMAMNSSGSHWVRYGTLRETVIRLKVVLADGELVEISSVRDPAAANNPSCARLEQITQRVERIVNQYGNLIQQYRPQVQQNQAGYNLFDLYQFDEQQRSQLDLTRLLTGSEGTLGIITEATLQTEPIPRHRGVALLFFHRLDTAARAAVEISRLDVAACDLLDRRLLSLARETNPEYHRLIPSEAEAMLLVEFQAADNRSLQSKLDQLTTKIQRRKKLAFDIKTTTQKEVRDLYWRIVRRTVPTLFKLKGAQRALPFIEDIAIAPEKIPEFLQDVHRILNENEVTASVFAHTPQGLISVRPFMSLASDSDLTTMQRLANQLFEKVLEYGGSVSGAHGDGLSRTWFLRRQYGPLLDVMAEIKHIFDPQNILNPGKIVGHPHSGLVDQIRSVSLAAAYLPVIADSDSLVSPTIGGGAKLTTTSDPAATTDPAPTTASAYAAPPTKPGGLPILVPNLNWDLTAATLAARNCNGCGRCRTQAPQARMCPLFRLSPREEASPRAKANLMRGVFTGKLDAKLLAQDDFKEIVDLCVNCHQCRLECPASVDIPKLMVEAKSQFYSVNGLKISDWLLTRLDWLYSIAGSAPGLTNVLLQNRSARWLLDRLLGVAQGRKLPLFDRQTFARWSQRQRLNRPAKQSSRKVVYFVDAFVNWNDSELGKAFVKVLDHNGIHVLVPSGQNVSGMSLISEGSLVRAKRLAIRNIELFAEFVRQGYQIVTTEPSAALALSHEYLNMLDDADAKLVAENTTDASNYLLQLHRRGELELDFDPVNAAIGYHLPCHQRALGEEIPALELLRLIPGLKVEMIEKGCSGMAGTFGLKRKNYLRSLRMGFPLINAMRSPEIVAGATECSTCKIQMEQGTTKPTVHPLKILALAYGLMPELENLFQRRSGELVIS